MKKGLLSILAASAVLVGCQNYDDQFDALNTQITSLKTQVEGLAGVQSDVAALKGLITSLQTTVDGVTSANSALSADLATVLADLETVEAAVADVATPEDLAQIETDLDEVDTSLQELLTQNNVYAEHVKIYNKATLDFADALGNKLNIVNNNIDIYATADMDTVKLQNVINRIKTVTQNFHYKAKNSSVGTIRFDSLIGTDGLVVDAPHNLHFASLASAGNIQFGNGFSSKVKAIDMQTLNEVKSFAMAAVTYATSNNTISAANTTGGLNKIDFNNSDMLDLGSLPKYTNGSLTIVLDGGSTLDIGSLDDIDDDGDQQDLDLDITGASEVSLPNYNDGDFSATEVGTVNLPVWTGDSGTLTLSQVENVTLGAVQTDVTIGTTSSYDSDLVSIDITAVKGSDTGDVEPAVTIYSTNVEEIEISGDTDNVMIKGCTSLEELTVDAKVHGTLTIDGNTDLVTANLTGSAAGVIFKNNTDMEILDIGMTTIKSNASGAKVDGVVEVVDNQSLTDLTIGMNNLEKLVVTGNDDLVTIDGSKVKVLGATAKPTVNIYDNDFVAEKAINEKDGTSDKADGAAGDKGDYNTNSGLDTLFTYLSAVAGDSDSTANVFWDTIDIDVDAEGSTNVETPNVNYSSTADTGSLQILKMVPGSGSAKGAKAQKRAIILPTSGTFGYEVNSYSLFGSSLSAATSLTLQANKDAVVADIKGTTNVARAASVGVTMTAKRGGQSQGYVSLIQLGSAATVAATSAITGERYTTTTAYNAAVSATNYGFGVDDLITLTVGSNSVQTSITQGTATTLTAIASNIVGAWNKKYSSTGTASAAAIASISHSAGTISIDMLQQDSAGYGVSISVSVAGGTATGTTAKNIDYFIGGNSTDATKSASDNTTTDRGALLVLTANTAGELLSELRTSNTASSISAGTATELTTAEMVNDDDAESTGYTRAQESRTDVANGEESASNAVAATKSSRVDWLN